MTRVPPGGMDGTGPVPTGPGEDGADPGGTDTGAPAGPMPMPVAEVSPAAVRRATCANPAAVGYRAAGSLDIARSTIARTDGGTSPGSGGGCSRTCRMAISSGLSPSNGRCPDRHWYA